MDYQEGFSVNGKARKNLPSEEYQDTHEKLFGWRCWDCQVNNKGEQCSKCKKDKKEVCL